MAVNQTGIAISIKAFLPTGKSLDETFAALSIVKAAHETGDYSALLAAASVEDVKTEQKTRRVEAPSSEPQPQPQPEDNHEPEKKPIHIEGPQPERIEDPDFTDLPETAPEGEPSLQDIADYGTDDDPATSAHSWDAPQKEAPPRKGKKAAE